MAQVKTNNGTSGGQRHKGKSNFKMQYKNLVTDLTLAVHGEDKGKKPHTNLKLRWILRFVHRRRNKHRSAI